MLEKTRPKAQRYADDLFSLTGWPAQLTLLLGGALRFTEYDYFQEQVVKFIIMKHGLASATGSDREFADGNVLAGFVDEFLEVAAR